MTSPLLPCYYQMHNGGGIILVLITSFNLQHASLYYYATEISTRLYASKEQPSIHATYTDLIKNHYKN
jgi:hypothetical protein